MTENKKQQWIITPGLYNEVKRFEKRVSESSGKPIIICGPTGVGKSLFVQIFRCSFIEKGGDPLKIQTLNCATLNKEMISSELYGHKKGAFTDAKENNQGLIKKAKNGVLIFEEIGELPETGEANLLTFIEDGNYRRIGDPESKHAKVQIIGTTNKQKDDFRPDFWNRFLPFYVPAVHKRREDILYYLKFLCQDIIPELFPWEVMAFLCYNWPGNVREIDRIGRLLKTYIEKDKTPKRRRTSRLRKRKSRHRSLLLKSHEENGCTDLKVDRIAELNADLKRSGVDVVHLEKVLEKYRLSFDQKNNTKRAFDDIDNYKDFDNSDMKIKYTLDDVEVGINRGIEVFDKCYEGLWVYTELFFRGKSLFADENLLDFDVGQKGMLMPRMWGALELIENPSEKDEKLEKEIFEYRIGKKLKKGDKRIPDPDTSEFRDLLKSFNVGSEKESKSINSMTWEEVRLFYYRELFKKTRGIIADAARIAKVNRKTFTSRINKMGIDPEEFK